MGGNKGEGRDGAGSWQKLGADFWEGYSRKIDSFGDDSRILVLEFQALSSRIPAAFEKKRDAGE